MKFRVLILLFGVIALAARRQPGPAYAPAPAAVLSAYGFFEGPLHLLQPAKDVIPYELRTPLFSNYAEKARFIKLPAGTTAHYNPDDVFDLPEGTYLIKHFYYPVDFRKPEGKKIMLETRVMYHDATGWQTWPYIWNDAQNEAVYDPAGETKQLTFINAHGRKVQTAYLIPNKNQCKGCHMQGGNVMPIGIAARHLNSLYDYGDTTINQLNYWKQAGLLQGLPQNDIPANADWQNLNEPIDKRARAYLDINCGHCHRPDGAANTSGLFLHAHEKDPAALGVFKTPVAAGRGSGGRLYDIVPGKPDASILLYRMQTNDPGIAMPEIGREQLHTEGIALIREWIRQMKHPPS